MDKTGSTKSVLEIMAETAMETAKLPPAARREFVGLVEARDPFAPVAAPAKPEVLEQHALVASRYEKVEAVTAFVILTPDEFRTEAAQMYAVRRIPPWLHWHPFYAKATHPATGRVLFGGGATPEMAVIDAKIGLRLPVTDEERTLHSDTLYSQATSAARYIEP